MTRSFGSRGNTNSDALALYENYVRRYSGLSAATTSTAWDSTVWDYAVEWTFREPNRFCAQDDGKIWRAAHSQHGPNKAKEMITTKSSNRLPLEPLGSFGDSPTTSMGDTSSDELPVTLEGGRSTVAEGSPLLKLLLPLQHSSTDHEYFFPLGHPVDVEPDILSKDELLGSACCLTSFNFRRYLRRSRPPDSKDDR